jgi:hypothetical protein
VLCCLLLGLKPSAAGQHLALIPRPAPLHFDTPWKISTKPPVHHSASIRPAHDTLKPGPDSALNLQESPRRCCTRRVLRTTYYLSSIPACWVYSATGLMASDIPVRGTAAYAANLFVFFVSSPSRVFVFSPWGIMPISTLQQPPPSFPCSSCTVALETNHVDPSQGAEQQDHTCLAGHRDGPPF